MDKNTQQRKICDSWYHQKWFRILLILVGVDMIVLGGTFVIGLDVMSLVQEYHSAWRIIGGFAYIIVAIFIIHYALSYTRLKNESYLTCQHCAHTTNEE